MFSFSLKSTENEYTGVNFINVKCTKNSYERRISAAFSSYMYVEKRRSYEIFVRITLMKLTTGFPRYSPSLFAVFESVNSQNREYQDRE